MIAYRRTLAKVGFKGAAERQERVYYVGNYGEFTWEQRITHLPPTDLAYGKQGLSNSFTWRGPLYPINDAF